MSNKLDEIHSRRATVVFNSRMDARYLATLLAFWHSKGEKPTSVSELVRLSVESFAGIMMRNGLVELVQSHKVAFEMFERAGILNKKMRELNRRNLSEAIAEEELNLDSLQGVDPIAPHRLAPKPSPAATPDFNVALNALEKNLETDLQDRVAKAKEKTQEFKDSLIIPPDVSDTE